MSFPVYIDLFGARIHPHMLLELVAYSAGFQIYLRTRHRWKHAPVPTATNLWIIVGCVAGALVGSHLLNILDSPLDYWAHRSDPAFWLAGKTVVGGLIGGWIGVEIVKKRVGITYATGDAYVFPLLAGMAIGRVGCFLTGLEDATYGTATSLPWGVDFGDGIARHPTQLYEIAALVGIGIALFIRLRKPYPNGYLFRLFMFLYFLMRFSIDMLKPRFDPYLGLSMIQIACVAGMIVTGRMLLAMRRAEASEAEAQPALNPEPTNG
jgi:phosphatidylglycerol:prolipoprotein diacylglycerol transferase